MSISKLKSWAVIVLMLVVAGVGAGRKSWLAAGEDTGEFQKGDSAQGYDRAKNPYRTSNFLVQAPSAVVARRIGQAAEHLRKEQAMLWLGKELPAWPKPCPIQIRINEAEKGGYSNPTFHKGKLIGQDMSLTGSLEDILADTLPHEMTHLILANWFGRPVPRWADEGAAILAEGDKRKHYYDLRLRKVVTASGPVIGLRKLFTMEDYPADWTSLCSLYSEGYSITRFLIESGDRHQFLLFFDQGMREGWDQAVQAHYGFRNVEQLEKAWLKRVLPNSQKKYAIHIAIKDHAQDGIWKTVCETTFSAQEGAQAIFFSGVQIARPRETELYPVGFAVGLIAIPGQGAKVIVEATVEKSDLIDLEEGGFDFQKQSLETIAEVNLGDLHTIRFAKDHKGKDITIVELRVKEVKK